LNVIANILLRLEGWGIDLKLNFNGFSIKWKIFSYLAGLISFIIILLWLFQIVFLDSFYKHIKIKNIENSAEIISKNIDDEDIGTIIKSISQENDICIRVIDEEGRSLYSSYVMFDCIIRKMPYSEIYHFFKQAQDKGGTTFELLPQNISKDREDINRNIIGRYPPPNNITQSIIYGTIVKRNDGLPLMVMLNSTISPVNATVETLRVQLIYITVILIILSVFLAFFISRKISQPIIKINDSAKELGKGNYDIKFEGKGYLEISELNSTLNYAAKELSKVESLRRELIANVSHDLRTPLTMITGYGEVIRDIPGENTPENVQIIIDEAKRLTDLVNDMLDISKLQSGIQELDKRDFNITETIREVLKRYTKLTEQDGYRIEFIYDDDVYVNADEIKIVQVIYNLINNAITYTGKDKFVEVRQKLMKGHVRIEVIDTGEGISEENLPLIWDRYYKVDKTHKRASIGTGLGLSIVKMILDMHDLEYGVISKEGQGSTFWFELSTIKIE